MKALLLALSITQFFISGVKLAENGAFQEAERVFLQVYEECRCSGAAYNLGWIKYKRGEYGEAIYWWRRAALLGDEDALFNIDVMKRKLLINQEEEALKSSNHLLCNLSLLLAAFFLVLLFIYLGFRRQEPSKIIILLLCMLFAVFAMISFSTYNAIKHPHIAVVVKTARAFSQPSKVSIAFERLEPGEEYKILKETEEWVALKLEKGVVGWVEKKALKLIKEL